MCACVRACMRACERACVRACVRACERACVCVYVNIEVEYEVKYFFLNTNSLDKIIRVTQEQMPDDLKPCSVNLRR